MRRPLRTLARNARGYLRDATRFAPGRPAIALGLRAAVATTAPALAAHAWLPAAQPWASVAGFLVALADKGGAYRTRALTMGSVTVAGAVATVLAALVPPALAAPLMLVWATLCGLGGAWGPAAAGVGNSAAVLFAISLSVPAPDLASSIERGAWLCAGGGWAMGLGLLLWPVRVYKPARRAVARCLELLADQAADTGRLAASAGDTAWQLRLQRGHRELRESIEVAGAMLAATRRGRGEAGRGERLLVVLQQVEHIFGALVALEDVIETARVSGGVADRTHAQLQAALDGCAGTLRELAARVVREDKLPPMPALAWGPEALRGRADDDALPAAARAELRHAAELVGRLHVAGVAAGETIGMLHDDRGPIGALTPAATPQASLLEPVRDLLTLDSVVLRHALRLGVSAAAAVALTTATGLDHGRWVTITVIVLMQPHAPATVTRGLQRVGGTVLGGVAAALIATYVREPLVIMVIAFVLAALSTAVLQINYALFSFLLTPSFVLLAEVETNNWDLAPVRALNTIIGGAIAFAASWALWPSRERRHFPDHAAAAAAALRGYVDAVIAAVTAGAPVPAPDVAAARRHFGLAINNADASLQRLLAESHGQPEALEPAMTMLLYLRRVSATLAALASTRIVSAPVAGEGPRALGEHATAVLADLEAALREGRRPLPLPALDEAALADPDPMRAARRARLAQQVGILHRAVERWLGGRGRTQSELAEAA
jgi:uncharacterized membrane protein YccC